MFITKLTIKGFRAFDSINGVEFKFKESLCAFIGLNSAGKTAALEALRKMFGSTNSERELLRQDFHNVNGENLPEIRERSLKIEVRIDFSENERESIPHFFNHMVVDGEGQAPYLRIRLEASWQKSPIEQEGIIGSNMYFITVPEGEAEVDKDKHPFQNYLRSLVQILYVPAIRRPAEQLKYATGSILYRVLNGIHWGDGFQERYENKIEEINELFNNVGDFGVIQNSLTSFWRQFHKDSRYEDSDLNFGNSNYESVLKKLEVSFSPTGTHRKFYVDDLGDGYRSLFYLTLICALLEVEKRFLEREGEGQQSKPLLTILAIEEPENHIAPQLLGRVIKILKSISNQGNCQVLLTSHTPAIVKRLNPESIFHFQINKDYEAEVNPIILPEKDTDAYKYVKEAVQNYPEIYFAKLVVIGEGDSEEVIFNRLMQVYNTDFDDNLVSFAPLGHRFVNHIWKLLHSLRIPFITLLDLDVEREGGGYGRIKYAIDQLIKIDVSREDLLTVDGGRVLNYEELQEMNKWKLKNGADLANLDGWVKTLEEHDVFYSGQLDIDFLMLKQFPGRYKAAVPQNGGPRIPEKETDPVEYQKKVVGAMKATLKSEEAEGLTYSEEDKELMVWYNYHFLGRGKPVTHIEVLSSISDEEIEENVPPVFDRVFARISELLAI